MRLDTRALANTSAVLWAVVLLLVGLAHMAGGYGTAFLELMDSLYPGYDGPDAGFGELIIGTLYALVDGWICGWIFAWLYNRMLPGGGSGA